MTCKTATLSRFTKNRSAAAEGSTRAKLGFGKWNRGQGITSQVTAELLGRVTT